MEYLGKSDPKNIWRESHHTSANVRNHLAKSVQILARNYLAEK